MDSNVPSWTSENNLHANGLYFEGFVDDLEAVLDYHKILTVRMVIENLGWQSLLASQTLASTLKEKKTKHPFKHLTIFVISLVTEQEFIPLRPKLIVPKNAKIACICNNESLIFRNTHFSKKTLYILNLH